MKLRLALLAVPAALALAACGSSGGGGSDETTPAPADTTPTTSATVESTPASSPAAAGDPYCAKLATFPDMLTKFQTQLATPKAADLKQNISEAVTYFKGLQPGAPAALAPKIQTVISALGQVKSVDDIPALSTKVLPMVPAVQEWITQNCTAS